MFGRRSRDHSDSVLTEDRTQRVPGADPEKGTESGKAFTAADGSTDEEAVHSSGGHAALAVGLTLTVLGVAALWIGVWLFEKTRGTRLLFSSVTVGRIARYYGIVLAAGAVLLVIGIPVLHHALRKWRLAAGERKEARRIQKERRKAEQKRSKEQTAPYGNGQAGAAPAAAKADAVKCPNCGHMAAPGTRFCGSCGCRLDG